MSGPAGRAELAIEDAAASDTGVFHLPAIRFGQVQLASALQRFPLREKAGELSGDIGPNLVAACADARSDSGVDVVRRRIEIGVHFFEGAFHYCCGSAAPTRVNRGDGAIAAVEEQDGDAIGGTDADARSDLAAHQGIALALSILRPGCIENAIGVDLAQSDIDVGVTGARAETMFLPNELLESIASIDTVASQAE